MILYVAEKKVHYYQGPPTVDTNIITTFYTTYDYSYLYKKSLSTNEIVMDSVAVAPDVARTKGWNELFIQ